ncbi:BSP-domain-containing protein [Hypoxylon rubiginosum]|uniref:BSP-domain-containing protein n=1 Tax=Hypoxylon rubiginosum TaxID=110542 RepID=A0ACB9ZDX3_9PEZI|nr:BSP-domain-containing protein [Hypoxylon rubiginosum]
MSLPDSDRNLSGVNNLDIHLRVSIEDSVAEKNKDQSKPTPSMPLPPNTTPAPKPVFMPGMSHRTEAPPPAAPTSSAIPVPPPKEDEIPDQPTETKADKETSSIELPRLRLHIQDIAHEGSSVFLSAVNASTVLRSSIQAIDKHLYSSLFTSPASTSTSTPTSTSAFPRRPHPPPTRSVTLILRDMDGVAYTTGSDLDSDHKEIHFSLRYIKSIAPPSRRTAEIAGVVTHELVHCYQWNGKGAAPGGLIEGVADWVRLQCDLAPPHWRREVAGKWDAGYQHTAYLLQYLEDRFGEGTVRKINDKLRRDKYEEKAFWTELLGRPIEQLFDDYKETLEKKQ